jgi:hypothetical protein
MNLFLTLIKMTFILIPIRDNLMFEFISQKKNRSHLCSILRLRLFIIAYFGMMVFLIPTYQLNGQLKERYFYHSDVDYGSNASFSAFSVFFNGGFDILRNTYDTRVLKNIDFRTGITNVNNNIIHANRIIKDYNSLPGHDFVKDQLLPHNIGIKRSPWVPNYQSHLIGEGMICRQLAEWYSSKNVPMPYFWAVLNTCAFQYTNEVIEMSWNKGESVDPIADLLIFNPAGWILFYFDPIARFFAEDLHLANWSLQPCYNPYTGVVTNAGEQYIIKINLPKTRKFQVFYGWGIDGTAGLCYKSVSGLNYSAGYGLKARRLKASIERKQSLVYPEMEPNFVFYVDRRESLLLSVNQTGIHEIHTIVNIYPGYVLPKRFGVYVGFNTYLGLHFGATYSVLPFGLFLGK